MEQTITVADFQRPGPRRSLQDRFIDAGLPPIFWTNPARRRYCPTTHPKAHMRVRVPKAENERAKKLMAEWDARDGVMREAVRCPQCGSSRIEYPQFSRRTGMAFFFGVLAAIHFIPRLYFCEDCKFEWPDKEPVKPDLDVLNWPKERS